MALTRHPKITLIRTVPSREFFEWGRRLTSQLCCHYQERRLLRARNLSDQAGAQLFLRLFANMSISLRKHEMQQPNQFIVWAANGPCSQKKAGPNKLLLGTDRRFDEVYIGNLSRYWNSRCNPSLWLTQITHGQKALKQPLVFYFRHRYEPKFLNGLVTDHFFIKFVVSSAKSKRATNHLIKIIPDIEMIF